jgi:hypothetical protein
MVPAHGAHIEARDPKVDSFGDTQPAVVKCSVTRETRIVGRSEDVDRIPDCTEHTLSWADPALLTAHS